MHKSEVKILDKMWSDKIRARGKCERCGKPEGLQSAHIISRSHRNTRWDLENGLCLCSGCHNFWAHKEPLEFADWVKDKLGMTKYEHLKARGQMDGHGMDFEIIKLSLLAKRDK